MARSVGSLITSAPLPPKRAVKSAIELARVGEHSAASRSESLAMTDQVSFQFQCPSCGAVLQAALGNTLTSVQCGECSEVFDVQLPGRHARAHGTEPGLPSTGGYRVLGTLPRSTHPKP